MFLPSVQNIWKEGVEGSDMYKVCQKLRLLKSKLKKLNRENFSDLSNRVLVAKQFLEGIQIQLDNLPSSEEFRQKEREAYSKLVELKLAEESFYKQKSRIQWLKLGDQNTKFFFKSINFQRNKSRIVSITRDDGAVLVSKEEIAEHIVNYYQSLLGTTSSLKEDAEGKFFFFWKVNCDINKKRITCLQGHPPGITKHNNKKTKLTET
ncbi:hypothetical protein U1Q18_052623 [Sarracenia purpurea var. burkii]